ncbi:MAG: DUF2948 family protein [Parvularculaceae bacterium]
MTKKNDKLHAPLRLIAADAEDLKVISSYLQDAVLKVGDIAYQPQRRRFAMVLNRFRWERSARGPQERVRTGIHFDDVARVAYRNIRTDAKDAVLSLLAIDFETKEDGGGAVTLTFSGGGAIRLDVESVNALLDDISRPWRTASRPKHD